MKCCSCGKEFQKGQRPDGLPNGVEFEFKDGSMVNCCTECIITKGKRSTLTNAILNQYYGREDPDEHMV